MEYNRMSTEDMLQYCDEALAWDQFGPVDIFFFESVKRILLGQCPAIETPEEDELANVTTPVTAEELISFDKNTQELNQAMSGEHFFEQGMDYTMTDADGKEN
ncbi:MAG: hypothetical protein K2I93_05665 [Oscillospiraceae bacterium]|nr:hypothetical protein [Oscillospiraceae bacterium]